MKPMHTLTLLVPSTRVDDVSDALMFEHEALSVSVEDADAGTDAEQALFGEPGMAVDTLWARSTMVAMFATAEAARLAGDALLAQPGAADVAFVGLGTVPDTDWVRATQSQFDPVAITPEFWVVPSWYEVPAAARIAIRLDPGLAFGSGTHATTRMCLRWVARQASAVSRQRVLDYGCGSGILAIAAGMHGAASVDAVDIDDAALTATRDNAAANAVALRVSRPDGVEGPYGVVLANILATPLKLLAPVLGTLVGQHGHLVLAGLLARQVEELQACYAPYLALTVEDDDDGWVLLTGRVGQAGERSSTP